MKIYELYYSINKKQYSHDRSCEYLVSSLYEPIQFYDDIQWYINGYRVSDEIYSWANEMNIDLDNLSDEDKALIRIYWENYDGK